LRQLSPGRCQPTRAPLVDSRAPSGPRAEGLPSVRRASLPALAGLPTRPLGRQPSWAFVPYSASGTGDPLSTGVASPATVRPQRFSRSRRFSPPGTSPGLFHPGNAPGLFRTFRVFFLPKSWSPSGAFSSPAVGRSRAPVRAHETDSAPEAFSLRESAPSNGFLGPPGGRYPPGLHPFKAFSSAAVESASRPVLSYASHPLALRP